MDAVSLLPKGTRAKHETRKKYEKQAHACWMTEPSHAKQDSDVIHRRQLLPITQRNGRSKSMVGGSRRPIARPPKEEPVDWLTALTRERELVRQEARVKMTDSPQFRRLPQREEALRLAREGEGVQFQARPAVSLGKKPEVVEVQH